MRDFDIIECDIRLGVVDEVATVDMVDDGHGEEHCGPEHYDTI